MLLITLIIIGWWRSTPEKPTDILGRSSSSEQAPTEDVEQLAFQQKHQTRSDPAPQAASAQTTSVPVTRDSITDHAWIERLVGSWTLDLGNRAATVEFGSVPIQKSTSGAPIEIFALNGLGLPPFYTVLRRPEGGSFLIFRDNQDQNIGLLDDLESHGSDLFSYRLGGTAHRYYGHRSASPRDLAGHLPLPPDSTAEHREERREEIQITVERSSKEELWQRSKRLRENGRLDSLEITLNRLLGSYPDHRQAQRWRRNLPKWRARQERSLRSRLNAHLNELQGKIKDQDMDLLDLWLSGARAPTGSFFQSFFRRFDRTGARYLLKESSIQDGTLIFEVTLTLDGFDGRQRSIETHPWRGRLYGGRFLDPFPG